jgi:hypothetical protein
MAFAAFTFAQIPSVLLMLPEAAYPPASGGSYAFDTSSIVNMAVDIDFISFQGGTAPTITFLIQRLGADGKWYDSFAPGALMLAAAGILSVDLGVLSNTFTAPASSAAQHNIPTSQGRFKWTTTGAPNTVTFSAGIIGRPG